MKNKNNKEQNTAIRPTRFTITRIAHIRDVVLERFSTVIDDDRRDLYLVTGVVHINNTDTGCAWSYANFGEAWNRFFEAVILDIEDEFAQVMMGLSPDFAEATEQAVFERHNDEVRQYSSIDDLQKATFAWERKMAAELLRAEGRSKEGLQIESFLKTTWKLTGEMRDSAADKAPKTRTKVVDNI